MNRVRSKCAKRIEFCVWSVSFYLIYIHTKLSHVKLEWRERNKRSHILICNERDKLFLLKATRRICGAAGCHFRKWFFKLITRLQPIRTQLVNREKHVRRLHASGLFLRINYINKINVVDAYLSN